MSGCRLVEAGRLYKRFSIFWINGGVDRADDLERFFLGEGGEGEEEGEEEYSCHSGSCWG